MMFIVFNEEEWTHVYYVLLIHFSWIIFKCMTVWLHFILLNIQTDPVCIYTWCESYNIMLFCSPQTTENAAAYKKNPVRNQPWIEICCDSWDKKILQGFLSPVSIVCSILLVLLFQSGVSVLLFQSTKWISVLSRFYIRATRSF